MKLHDAPEITDTYRSSFMSIFYIPKCATSSLWHLMPIQTQKKL